MNVAQPLVQASLLGEAIDTGPVLVLVADDEMRFVAVNKAACDALGYEREELLAKRVTDIAQYPEASGEYAEMMAAGERTGRSQLVRKDGSLVEIEYRASRTKAAQMTFYVMVGFPIAGAATVAPPAWSAAADPRS
jgi:PAS domain S-box-containing protein